MNAMKFSVLVIVLGWVACLPLWISGQGLQHPLAPAVAAAMMFTPGVSALMMWWLEGRKNIVEALGLRIGNWRYGLVAWFGVPVFCVAAPFVSAGLGFYELDLTELSGFRDILISSGGEAALDSYSIQTLVALQLAATLVAPLVNAPFALGEELGWRGYLLPRIVELGQTRALLISGLVWGAWHAPLILLGHNYPQAPVLGVFLMVGFCILMGIIFGWLRLVSGSIWPAVVAHGALNGSGGAFLLFHKSGSDPNSIYAGITGLTGWILPACFIGFLYATKRLDTEAK